jgi:GDP-4-dehydro-6-deoxy-D-mannose reductase
MKVGELLDERDFLSVDDVIDLYVKVIDAGRSLQPGLVLNAASGISHRIGDVLAKLLSASSVKIQIEVDPSRLRNTRVPRIVGDSSRAQRVLGWRPTKPLDQILSETLEHWRSGV